MLLLVPVNCDLHFSSRQRHLHKRRANRREVADQEGREEKRADRHLLVFLDAGVHVDAAHQPHDGGQSGTGAPGRPTRRRDIDDQTPVHVHLVCELSSLLSDSSLMSHLDDWGVIQICRVSAVKQGSTETELIISLLQNMCASDGDGKSPVADISMVSGLDLPNSLYQLLVRSRIHWK